MHRPGSRGRRVVAVAIVILAGVGAARPAAISAAAGQQPGIRGRETVVPGITVLLEDSVGLIRGKRVGLLTNQTGVDRAGTSDIALLTHSPLAQRAGVHVALLFS